MGEAPLSSGPRRCLLALLLVAAMPGFAEEPPNPWIEARALLLAPQIRDGHIRVTEEEIHGTKLDARRDLGLGRRVIGVELQLALRFSRDDAVSLTLRRSEVQSHAVLDRNATFNGHEFAAGTRFRDRLLSEGASLLYERRLLSRTSETGPELTVGAGILYSQYHFVMNPVAGAASDMTSKEERNNGLAPLLSVTFEERFHPNFAVRAGLEQSIPVRIRKTYVARTSGFLELRWSPFPWLTVAAGWRAGQERIRMVGVESCGHYIKNTYGFVTEAPYVAVSVIF